MPLAPLRRTFAAAVCLLLLCAPAWGVPFGTPRRDGRLVGLRAKVDRQQHVAIRCRLQPKHVVSSCERAYSFLTTSVRFGKRESPVCPQESC